MGFRHIKDYDLHNVIHAKKLPVKHSFSLHTIIITWFFLGKLPAPGTMGSLGAYPIFYYLWLHSPSSGILVEKLYFVIGILFFLGLWAIAKFHKETMFYDHQSIVIDEVVGQLLSIALTANVLSRVLPDTDKVGLNEGDVMFLINFALFRYFDIKKPFFLKYIDRNWKGAFAVMIDDVFAAFFAGLLLYIVCAAFV